MPGVKSRGEDTGTREAAVGLRERPRASGSSYPRGLLPRCRSLGRPFSEPRPRSWVFSVCFCFCFDCCTFSELSGHQFLRDPCRGGVLPSYTRSHEP